MQVARVSSSDVLRELAGPWNCLTRGIPFRSWQWLSSWWNHYQDGQELYVLTVRDNDQLVGIAPWYLSQSSTRGRVIRFLGSGEVCSDYLDLLLSVEHRETAVSAIADWLMKAVHSTTDRWDSLELDGIDEQDRTVAKLVGQLECQGCQVRQRTIGNAWRIELPDEWESYLGTLSKSHRKQVRRAARNLENDEFVLHTAKDREQLGRGMEILIDLHTRRRQSQGDDGCFASKRFASFLQEAAGLLLDADMLRLHWLSIAGQPAAAEFQLVGGNVAYAYQSGVDPTALEKEPGRIINATTIQSAIALGFAGFDFLRGDEPYKSHWRAQPRPISSWQVAATRTASRIRHAALVAGDTMRDLIKGGLSLTGMR